MAKPNIARETVDEGIVRLAGYKRQAAEYVLGGEPLGSFIRRVYEAQESDDVRDSLLPRVAAISDEIRKVANQFKGQGTGYLMARLGDDNFKRFGELMSENYRFLANGHTARYIAQLIDRMESGGRKFDDMVDLGCGPATMSRTMERPMTCVDVSEYMLELARKACESEGIDNRYVKALMQDISLKPETFDLATTSYSLHYQAQGRKKVGNRKGKTEKDFREIDDSIGEANRILRPEGIWIISLPSGVQPRSMRELSDELDYYGFDVRFADFVKSSRAIDVHDNEMAPRFRGSYIVIAQKTREAPQEYPTLRKLIYMSKDVGFAFGGTRTKRKGTRDIPPKEVVIGFDPDPALAVRGIVRK
ncbi:MAG: class I SAM-dependent methyltransferase [Candidatus Aenigmarchaeota archaeon]|nr:class I SAM-dependent methyltransferase [Candidatus Aenigmarchaeota archaeon]